MTARRSVLAIAAAALIAGCTTSAPSTDALAFRHAPLVREAFIADPSAHVFDGRIYVYGSHDVDEPPRDDEPGSAFVGDDPRRVGTRPIRRGSAPRSTPPPRRK